MTRNMTLFLLALIVGGLGLANVWMYLDPVTITPITVSNEDGIHQAKPIVEQRKTPSTLLESVEAHALSRPLFTNTRRPWVAPVVAPTLVVDISTATQVPAAPPNSPPSLVILGIQKIPSGSQALLQHPGQADAKWYEKDDKIDEWGIVAITELSVEIERDTEKLQLDLYPAATNRAQTAVNLQPSLDGAVLPAMAAP